MWVATDAKTGVEAFTMRDRLSREDTIQVLLRAKLQTSANISAII